MATLFDEAGPEDSLYERIRKSPHAHEEQLRSRLEAMWDVFEPLADTQFLPEFRRQPNARYWEMYLGYVLKIRGFAVESADSGPDLLVLHDGRRIWVEAIEATSGAEENPDRCPELPENTAFDFPEEQMLLRYRSAIEEKRRKRERYVESGLIEPDDPYVIAINAGSIPYSFVSEDPPRIMGAVYAVGPLQVHVSVSDGETLGVDYVHRPTLTRAKGAEVSANVFLDEAYSGISAVIYSGANVVNSPTDAGSDLVLIHNVHATAPVPVGLLPCAEEWVPTIDGDCLTVSKTEGD